MPFGPQIEGQTPLSDVSYLRDRSITNRDELNRAEADNIRAAHVKYFSKSITRRSAAFNLRWCYKLHREMFGNVWTFAGEIRRENLNLGVAHYLIETELQSLLLDLGEWDSTGSVPLIEQAMLLHYRAVKIHPFRDGNGRWSRMLANIWLHLKKHPVVRWPEEHIGSASVLRDEYLAAIKDADCNGFDALLELHVKYANASA